MCNVLWFNDNNCYRMQWVCLTPSVSHLLLFVCVAFFSLPHTAKCRHVWSVWGDKHVLSSPACGSIPPITHACQRGSALTAWNGPAIPFGPASIISSIPRPIHLAVMECWVTGGRPAPSGIGFYLPPSWRAESVWDWVGGQCALRIAFRC